MGGTPIDWEGRKKEGKGGERKGKRRKKREKKEVMWALWGLAIFWYEESNFWWFKLFMFFVFTVLT